MKPKGVSDIDSRLNDFGPLPDSMSLRLVDVVTETALLRASYCEMEKASVASQGGVCTNTVSHGTKSLRVLIVALQRSFCYFSLGCPILPTTGLVAKQQVS